MKSYVVTQHIDNQKNLFFRDWSCRPPSQAAVCARVIIIVVVTITLGLLYIEDV